MGLTAGLSSYETTLSSRLPARIDLLTRRRSCAFGE